jgi:hypothetical protein
VQVGGVGLRRVADSLAVDGLALGVAQAPLRRERGVGEATGRDLVHPGRSCGGERLTSPLGAGLDPARLDVDQREHGKRLPVAVDALLAPRLGQRLVHGGPGAGQVAGQKSRLPSAVRAARAVSTAPARPTSAIRRATSIAAPMSRSTQLTRARPSRSRGRAARAPAAPPSSARRSR